MDGKPISRVISDTYGTSRYVGKLPSDSGVRLVTLNRTKLLDIGRM